MTLQQLNDKVAICRESRGQYKVYIEYRGHQYTCVTNNSMAFDAINDWARGNDLPNGSYYTPKQAFQSFWDECKRINNLK